LEVIIHDSVIDNKGKMELITTGEIMKFNMSVIKFAIYFEGHHDEYQENSD